MPSPRMPIESLAEALRHAYPELDAVAAASQAPVYLVGGAVRDLLLGRGRADIDLVVEGDAFALAERLGADVVAHERFGTAKVVLDGHEVDIAGARSERYAQPGALPEVRLAAGIEDDLRRRDFTVNAIAVPLGGEPRLLDPHGGQADLEAGLLRVLHPGSFADDPTRAIRAARYAARLGFALDPATEAWLRATDLGTVSADRRRDELLRLAAEGSGPRGLALLAEWQLLELRAGGAELAAAVAVLLDEPLWSGFAARAETVLRAALGPVGEEAALAVMEPERPSAGFELARRRDPAELVLARALGAEWLDEYASSWHDVSLEIDGSDLLAAGVPAGPALGRGLRAALSAKLDGDVADREQELAVALEAARGRSSDASD